MSICSPDTWPSKIIHTELRNVDIKIFTFKNISRRTLCMNKKYLGIQLIYII